jgi:hypothetical protein
VPAATGRDSIYRTMRLKSQSAINFGHALVAVLGGNFAYFMLEKYLPARAHHVPFKLDLGVVVDFWFCLVFFGIIKTIARRRRDSTSRKP